MSKRKAKNVGGVPALVLVAALGTSGCGKDSQADAGAHEREARELTSATAELEPAIDSVNHFAWELYHAAVKPGENALFSPFSLDTALAMTYAAARGETREEMRGVLAIEGDDAAFHAALGALLGDLAGERGRGYTLRTANGFFASQDVAFSPEFTALVRGTYAAAVESVPFAERPDTARARANDFVAEATNQRIREPIPSGAVDALTIAVLVNAVHFEAPFATAFDSALTRDAPFILADGTEITHPLMLRKDELLSAEDAEFSLVELDYADAELALDVIVPLRRGSLAELEATLTQERLDALLSSATRQTISFGMPRFELTLDLDAKNVLRSLGMSLAFGDGDPDLTGMLADASELDPYVTGVFHRAFVRVDEAGAEAAAASAAVVGTRSAPPSVIAGQPFVFLIRDKLTGVILFLGRVADPRG